MVDFILGVIAAWAIILAFKLVTKMWKSSKEQ